MGEGGFGGSPARRAEEAAEGEEGSEEESGQKGFEQQSRGQENANVEEIEKQLTDALIIFEPRINRRTLRVNVRIERNILSIELTGELWVNPLPEKLFIKTELDLESSQCSIKEAGNG